MDHASTGVARGCDEVSIDLLRLHVVHAVTCGTYMLFRG